MFGIEIKIVILLYIIVWRISSIDNYLSIQCTVNSMYRIYAFYTFIRSYRTLVCKRDYQKYQSLIPSVGPRHPSRINEK